MKVFLITWGVFCVLVVVGLFIAYATDNLPGVPTPQQVGLEAAAECSPCEENVKRLKKAMEQSQKTAEMFYREGTDDNLGQLQKTLETFDSELSALEREKNKAAKTAGQPPDTAP